MIGLLRKNLNGRWEIVDSSGDRLELTSGDICEIEFEGQLIRSRIEFDGQNKKYILVVGTPIFDGMKARYIPPNGIGIVN